MQVTIKKEISSKGVGIHYNKLVNLKLKPAPENSGIVFIRTDILEKNNKIKVCANSIDTGALSTKLKNEDGIFVATVEHLISAIHCFKINNLIIEIDGPEVPIMDGGSEDFCFMLECAGTVTQNAPKHKIKLLKEIKVKNGEAYIIAKPSNNIKINFVSDFPSNKIKEQSFSFDLEKQDFVKEISSAKTIANILEVETLQKMGMGLGGSLQNTMVYNENSILNESYSYNINDFVKHKILDFMGDIYLECMEVIAEFECYKSGHKLNHALICEILKTNNYQLI